MMGYMKMRPIFQIMAIYFLLVKRIEAEKCPENKIGPEFSFPRIFVLRFFGPPTPMIDEARAAMILGSCHTTRELGTGMRQYFEKFGIDISTMTNAYETFENDNFTISAFGNHPDGDYRVLLSSFYDFAEVRNAKVTFAAWPLLAKVQLDDGERKLAPGFRAVYGMYRLMFPQQEFCIEFHDRSPVAPFVIGSPNSNFEVDYILESKHLGNGTSVGLGRNINGTLDVRSIMTFGFPTIL